MGRTGVRSFRIVIADESAKRDGKVVEEIGFYDSSSKPPKLQFNKARLDYWVGKGAQPTESLRKIFSL